MRSEAMQAIEALLRAEGVPVATVETVRMVVLDAGMVRTGAACRALMCSRWTVERLCRRHGIRREARPGRLGARVDLAGLLAAVATK